MVAAANKLVVTPRGDTEIVLTREFDAPRELVFEAMTDPDLIPRFWGRRIDKTTVDTMDVRPGGKWRFISKSPEGETAFRGEFKEIVPPERIVWTFEWEGLPGHISTDTVVFQDLGNGRTRIVDTSVFANKEDRDRMIQSGMESGASQLYDRLEELLAELKTRR